MKKIALIALSCLVLPTSAHAASFDCSKASTKVEKLICDDSELSELDNEVSKVYQQAQEQSRNKSKEIAEQRMWIKTIRNACQNINCLKTVYKNRFEVLTNKPMKEGISQSESAPYAVRCDIRNQLLIVSESGLLPTLESSTPHRDVSEFSVDPSSLTKISETDGNSLRLPDGRKLFRCQLRQGLYKVIIEPNIQNARMNGECGATEPDISLTVHRNNDLIFANLEFQKCRGSNSGRTINRVLISEATNSIKVLSVPNEFFLPIRIERTFSLSSPPLDWQKAIFEDFPTGDANADLFIAAYKRDVVAIKKALQGGANPNATDLEGFPPLALLGTGRETAYRNKKLEEFNRQSEEIANVLFAAGAMGNASNIHGVTLLEYLLATDVPSSVIEILLAHGANIKDGNPLKNAAMRADEKLIKKLIDNGVNPNQNARDGSTALWAAATTGFYSYWGKDMPPVTEFAKCVRLLLQNGAKVHGAVSDSMEMPWMLVRSFGKDERLKIILAEMIPYTQHDDIERAMKLAEQGSYPIAKWLKDQIH